MPRRDLTLLLCGASSLLVYAAAAQQFPLLQLYTKATNLDELTGSHPLAGLILALCITTLFAAYGLGYLVVRRAQSRFVSGLVLLLPVLAAIPLLLTYPFTSLDLYDYMFRGWMLVHYGANTFTVTPIAYFPADPLADYASWYRSATSYGPIWEAISFVTASLGTRGSNSGLQALLPMLLSYKLLAWLSYLLCGMAIWSAATVLVPQQRLIALYLWTWNPLVLWETIGAGHNDAWMLTWVLLALALFHNRPPRRVAALLALAAGALIKYTSGVLAPVVLVAGLRRVWQSSERGKLLAVFRFLVLSGIGSLLLALLTYLPFWAGLETFRQFRDRGELYNAAPLAIVEGLIKLALPGQSQQLTSTLALVLLGLIVLGTLWRTWNDPQHPERHALFLLLAFFYLANPWFQPWYVLWPLALACLAPDTRSMLLVQLLAFTALLSYVGGSFLRPALEASGFLSQDWSSISLVWQTLLALGIYLPPLLIVRWFARRWAGQEALAAGAD